MLLSDPTSIIDRDDAIAAPSDGERAHPLSFAQARLWILDRLQPGNPAYNIPATIPLRGAVNVEMLSRALDEILLRHEALRTVFRVIDGQPMQVIAPARSIALDRVDLRSSTGLATPADVGDFVFREGRHAFDLGTGPLLRASLARIGPGDHLLMLVMHHIVSDGWSMAVLTRELTELYMAFLRGQPSPLADLPVQYADFTEWQAEWFTGQVMQRQLGYWRDRLTGLRPLLNLPTDRPRPPIQTSRGSVRGFTIDRQTCERIKALAQANGATLFMTLLAAFKTLLFRLSGETDIAIGTPIANRTQSELEGLIGFFVNTLLLRTDLSGDPSFVELLARERDTALGAYGNQDMPFERLVEELQPDRDLSRNPLFQILFAVQNFGIIDRNAVPIQASNLQAGAMGNGTAKFDLTLSVLDTGAGAQGFLEYNCDLFDEATAEAMIARYIALLRDIGMRPRERLSRLSIWLPDEPAPQVDSPAPVADPLPIHLGARIAAHAAAAPEAIAAIGAGGALSYRDLDARSNQIAHAIGALGIVRGSTIAVAMPPCADTLVALAGVLKAGMRCTPLDPADCLAAPRIARIVDTVMPALVVVGEGAGEAWAQAGVRVLGWGDLAARAATESDAAPAGTFDANDPALAIPRPCEGSDGPEARSHRLLVRIATDPAIGFTAGDRIACPPRIDGDRAAMVLFGALAAGAAIVFAPPESTPGSRRFATLLRDQQVSVMTADLADIERLAREFPRALRSLRLVLSDERRLDWGELREALPAEILDRIYMVSPRLRLVQPLRAIADAAASIPLGRPVAGIAAELLDADHDSVPAGVPGELFVEDQSTGVVARLAGGVFVAHCPWQDAIVHSGVAVDRGEIEDALVGLPGVAAAALTAQPRQGLRGAGLVAIVEAAVGATPEDLRALLAAQLPARLVPDLIVVDQPIPRDSRGAIDRRALDELAAALDARKLVDAPFVAPRDRIETALAGVWIEVLGRERIGVHDNFFRLGGHSLIATQMVARIGDMFRIDLPLQRIFEAPTIEQLARIVAPMVGSEQELELVPLVPVPRDRPLALSFAQQRLWFLDQFEPGSAFYNIALPMRFAQAVDPVALRGAIDDLVSRHETLRTSFGADGGEPVQVIAPAMPIEMPIHDLRGLPVAERNREANRLARVEAQRPFDLQHGPVIRAGLVQISGSESLLLLTIHHIAADGWSLDVLMRELLQFYDARRGGRVASLPALTIQYADFASWQRRWLRGAVLQAQVDYWKRSLGGAPPLLALPTDRPRPPVQTFAGELYAFAMSGATLRAAKRVSEAAQVTLFTTLLAAFYALLHRYTARDDLVVGSPIASRTRPELEGLIGFFANTLVLRVRLTPDLSFNDLIARVKEATLGAYAHQDIPFEKLVEELQPERNVAYHPLFQVMFALQNTGRPGEMGALPEGEDAPVLGAGVAKFDLTMFVSETLSDLRAGIEYNSDLFDAATITRFARHYETLLAAAASAPDRPIGSLPILTPEETTALADWNDTAAPRQAVCAHHRFEQVARKMGDAPAMLMSDRSVTYRELDARANGWAHRLVALGVGRGARVGIAMGRSFDMIVAVLAVLKAGAGYVPIDPDFPADRIAFMAADARLAVVLTQDALHERFARLDGAVVAIDAADPPALRDDPPTTAAGIGDLAYVIYTSGSTGRPKGVAMAHAPLAALVDWQIARSALDPGARTLQFASLSFDVSFQEIFATLGAGGTLVLVEEAQRRDPRLMWALLADARVARLFLPYVALQQLADSARHLATLPPLTEIVAAGEQLQVTPQIAALFERLGAGAALYNQYGPTESHVVTEAKLEGPAADWPARPSIGRPIPNATIQILDDRGQPCPIGVPGELYIGGGVLATGYLARPVLTAQRFLPDPQGAGAGRFYRTGDRARYRPGGEIEFLGRADDQVKIRGFRVELAEVEAGLRTYPAVQEAVVVARAEGGELRLVAHVQADASAAPSPQQLRAHLATTLPDYMIPAAYVISRKLPRTPTGKLSRRDLPDVEPSATAGSLDPRTPVETLLAQIWQEVLQLPRVGIRDSFFDLGGHSLLATRVISRVRDEFGVELPVRQMFETPTIEALWLSLVELAFEGQEDQALADLLAEIEEMPD
ncbi:non-ribosomal peptide synthetase [Sphingomonas qomolangmaensis]|uniref:Amino acid adenylation domain-containing protein n=1 Tax=Sphingomonas qomolangmaensis TaxID=2918765 RepID=A0ABY5L9A1_9SPHN|nr:non-ribosomal peptide synthetase [Sphingomonas qomolangmaensis]UUL82304.1 amino acid adenylation domain-containing protein [Sphingomonas qomolangmaensis]